MADLSQKTTLLILEDEPELAEILKEALEPVADQILVAHEGEQAWKMIESHSVDAILADYQVPKLTGLQLVERMLRAKRKIPIVIHTAHASPELITKATLYGALSFVTKPAKLKELEHLMDKAVKMGFRIRHIEDELEKICEENSIPLADRAQFKKDNKEQRIVEIITDSLCK